jgi:alanine racemase
MSAPSWLELDQIMAVVKANAYGAGTVAIARVLSDEYRVLDSAHGAATARLSPAARLRSAIIGSV